MARVGEPGRAHLAMAEEAGPNSLLAHVQKIIADLGLWHFHVRNSIGSARGWPDLVILGPNGALYRELKSTHGIISREQKDVGRMLTATGHDWAVWRPADLLGGNVALSLYRISAFAADPAANLRGSGQII